MDSSALDIAISALEKEISKLELSIDGLEPWLWRSSAIVAVGVLFEIIFLILEYAEDREAWRRGILLPATRPSLWRLSFEATSVLLVVAGIVGELWVGVLSAGRNTDLRGKNNRLVGLVRQKAADADRTATIASDTATKASRHEEKLEARTEREIDARVALERKLLSQGPRWLLLENGTAGFIKAMKEFAGQRATVVSCGTWGSSEPEPRRLQNDLVNFLGPLIFDRSHEVGAAWKVDVAGWGGCPPSGPTIDGGIGIYVNVNAGAKMKSAARGLTDELNRLRIVTFGPLTSFGDAPDTIGGQASEDAVIILVGPNPMQLDKLPHKRP